MPARKYWLGLSMVPGIGARRLAALVDYFGSPEKAWTASYRELRQAPGMDDRTCNNLLDVRAKINLDQRLDELTAKGITVATPADAEYPPCLKTIAGPPPVLYLRGKLLPADEQAIAIVGSRRCSAYGRAVAEQMGEELAAHGFTVISGMARGIDGAAHRGALKAGRTIAVLGCGVDVAYPPEHVRLMAEIAARGAVLSEYPPGTPPLAEHFPPRNRLISGLAKAVLVIEAGEKSGALITVDFALEQGRDVYAVPGNITNPYSKGCHRLIREGAKLVDDVTAILEDFAIAPRPAADPLETAQLTLDEAGLCRLIGPEPVTLEKLVSESGFAPGRLTSLLLQLELKGVLVQLPGQRFIRADRPRR